MYRIFFSLDWVLANVIPPEGSGWVDSPATGYGNLRKMVKEWATLRGHEICDEPDGCDLEIHVGDPGIKPDCHIHPSIVFTMFEVNKFPPMWEKSIVNWDYLALPSLWCMDCFGKQLAESYPDGHKTRIRRVRLGINPDKYPFIERPKRDTWTIICQGVEIRDRKGIMLMRDLTEPWSLPKDVRVILKILPLGPDGVIIEGFDFTSGKNGRFRVCSKLMDHQDFLSLLSEADYSVNPTSGEGFGYIPLEHLSTGLGVAVTPYSGITDYYDERYFSPIDFDMVYGPYLGSSVPKPRINSLKERIVWSFKNQDRVRETAREGSEWVKRAWPYTKMFEDLDTLVEEAINTVPNSVNTSRELYSFDYLGTGITVLERSKG